LGTAGSVPSFQGLGDLPGGRTESIAIAVSADGQVVTGWSATPNGTRAFRWMNGSMSELAGDGLTHQVGHALSADGGVVVGIAQAGHGTIAFRWEKDRTVTLAFPEGMTGFMDAWGVSGDGRKTVGTVAQSGRSEPVIWTGTDVFLLENLPGGRMSGTVTGISSDGSTVVGYSESDRGKEAVAWRAGAVHQLGVLSGAEWHSEAQAVSEDGKFIVGGSASPYGFEAVEWRDGRMTALGGYSREHEFLSRASGVSRDGAVIVGSAVDDRDASQAVIWDAVNGIRSLQRILTSDFSVDLSGWRLEAALDVSADGRTIVGSGRNPQDQSEGWIARLPEGWWIDASVPFRPNPSASGAELRSGVRARLGRGTGILGPFSEPHDTAIDPGGSIYVADSGNNAIRVLDSSGVLQRTWGSPGSGLQFDSPTGIALSSDGTVYVADTGRHRVQVITPDGSLRKSWGQKGSVRGALNRPEGIVIHRGRVYVADTGNDRIQVFDERGEFLQAFGQFGHGMGELDRPADLCIREDGRVLVVDRGNHRICLFDGNGSWVGSWGERGSLPGLFNRPTGIECLGDHVYVVDQANHRIQVFDAGATLRYIWGRQTFRPREAGGRISFPGKMAVAPDETRAIICEPTEDRCQLFGMIEEVTGTARNPSAELDANSLSGVAGSLHVGGNILAMTDDAAGHVLVYRLTESDPVLMTKVGLPGHGAGQISDPQGLWFDAATATLLIADTGNRRIQFFELDVTADQAKPFAPNLAKLRKTIGFPPRANSGSSEIPVRLRPGRLALASDGLLAVVDEVDGRVALFDRDFQELRRLGGLPGAVDELKRPVDVAFGRDAQQIFVLDAGRPGILVFDRQGAYIRAWGSRGTGVAEFLQAVGLTAGRDGFVYVSDQAGCRIQKFDESGNFVIQWGSPGVGAGAFSKPRDVGQDAQGRVYVNDYGNRRIQVFTPDGKFLRAIGSPLSIHPTLVGRKE